MSYTAPFRSAVLWLLEQPYRWNAESVASITGQARGRAKAYLTHLVVEDVLHEDAEGCYTHAWAYIVWRDQGSRTRPGGNSRTYLAAQAERAEEYQAQHQARVSLGAELARLRGKISPAQVAELAGVSRQTIYLIEHALMRARFATVERILAAIEALRSGSQAN